MCRRIISDVVSRKLLRERLLVLSSEAARKLIALNLRQILIKINGF